MTPVQVILIPVLASNKRVKYRPPSYVPSKPQDRWPRDQPIPDAQTRRELDIVRRDIAASRPAIQRFLREGPSL
jgi:hypothetical protein